MKTPLAILAFALLLPLDTMAQGQTLDVGTRVRVTSPHDNLKKDVAMVSALSADSIVLTGKMGTRTVALSNVTELDVSAGSRNQVMRSGMLGLGAGALVGVTAGILAKDDCGEESMCLVPLSDGQFAAVSALVFGATGFVAGAVIGAFTRTDRWVAVNPGTRATLGITRSGVASIGISRAF